MRCFNFIDKERLFFFRKKVQEIYNRLIKFTVQDIWPLQYKTITAMIKSGDARRKTGEPRMVLELA